MKIYKKIILVAFFITIAQQAGYSNSIHAQPPSQISFEPRHVPWSQLTFGVKNFSVKVTARVFLEPLPAAEVEAALIKSPQGIPFRISQPQAYKLSVQRTVDPLFGPTVKTTNYIWFNPQDATALGRMRLRKGNDDFKKVYRFTKQGVFRHRREPKDQKETSKDPEKWTDIKDSYYAHNLAQLGCSTVSDRLLLIYIISAANISKDGQPLSLCVFGKRQLFQVWLRPKGLHRLPVNFVEKKQQTETRRRGTIEALRVDLETKPLASDLEEVENFSFLGFRKKIAFYIDPVSNLPVQLAGEIPKAGEVTIKLHEVQLTLQ